MSTVSAEQSGRIDTPTILKLTVGKSPVQIPYFICRYLLIRSDSGNTGKLYVGLETVSVGNRSFPLAANEAVGVPAATSDRIWIVSDTDSQTAYIIIATSDEFTPNFYKPSSSGGVTSINSLTGAVEIKASSNITINTTGQDISIAATGTFSGTVNEVANAVETHITTTSPTTVVTYTPTAQGNFEVKLYARVTTATTNITATVNWDSTSGAQTMDLTPSSLSLDVGDYAFPPVYVDATSSGAITAVITSGTANNAYASASIIEIL